MCSFDAFTLSFTLFVVRILGTRFQFPLSKPNSETHRPPFSNRRSISSVTSFFLVDKREEETTP